MSNYLTLTRQGQKLILNAYQGPKHVGSLEVRSGLAHRQNFRTRANEKPGLYEPVPEDIYDLGPLEFAGGHGNYTKLWPTIKSPIWVEIIGWPRWIGFHFDAGQPGTAGCVGFITMQDLKTFVNWWNGYGGFSKLYVDWGLGTVQLPKHEVKKEVKEATATLKFRGKESTIVLQNGSALLNADDLRAVGIGVEWDGPSRSVKLKVSN